MDAAHPGTRFRVRRLAETASTNTVAADAAAAGEREGLVVVADHQTAGRGRLGRTWVAPPGAALLMSVVLRPPAGAVHAAVTAVGCAAAAACGRVAGIEPGLKWPNDLVLDDKKLGGILAEAQATAGNVASVVVGLGLNLRLPAGFPEDLKATATSIDADRDELLGAILEELEQRYEGLVTDGPKALHSEYESRCTTIGQRVSVELPNKTIEGRAVGLGEDGTLMVESAPGETVGVQVGDVVHLRRP